MKKMIDIHNELKLLLALIIVIGGIVFIFKYPQYKDSQYLKRENKNCRDEIERQYCGIIDTIVDAKIDYFFLEKSVTKRYLILNTGHIYTRYPFSKGDSIVKRKGESRYIIYRQAKKNDSVILNFECKMQKNDK
jgi:hypothetical protein